MTQNAPEGDHAMQPGRGCADLRELVGTDLPAREHERLARVDAFLRIAAARDMSPDAGPQPGRPSLRLLAAPPVEIEPTRDRTVRTHELKLTFSELALVYKALRAVKTLGVAPGQGELLDDTMQLVDLALTKAV